MNMDNLKNLFSYHAPQGDDAKRYEALREKGFALARAIALLTPAGPDQSSAIRKVREAIMTANAAIATATERPEFVDVLSETEKQSAHAVKCMQFVELLQEAAVDDPALALLLRTGGFRD